MRRTLPWLALLLAACEPGADAANLVVFGTIWTGDSAAPEARAMAVRGEAIVAVGDSATIATMVGPNTKILIAGSGLVVPGFSDDHVHLTDGGAQLSFVELRDADTPAEFTRRIKAYAATLRPGEWIIGGNWDHEVWRGAPLPRKEWIDSVTPNNPVFVQRLDGHMGLANSRALGARRHHRRHPGHCRRRPSSEVGVAIRPACSRMRRWVRCGPWCLRHPPPSSTRHSRKRCDTPTPGVSSPSLRCPRRGVRSPRCGAHTPTAARRCVCRSIPGSATGAAWRIRFVPTAWATTGSGSVV